MRTIHISRQRFDFIKAQGFRLPIKGSAEEIQAIVQRLGEGDTQYHILDDEFAFCDTCQEAFDSIDANSPAELETIKQNPDRAVIALRNMRQRILLRYREMCLRGVTAA